MAELFSGGSMASVIRGTDFKAARMGAIGSVPCRALDDKHLQRKRLQANDILIETAGGTKGQPTGRTLFVNDRLLAALPFPAVCASFARFLRIDTRKADPKFVFWFLQDLYNRREILQFHTQHTGVARFQFSTFADTFEFWLPDLPTQRRIADVLSAYDDLIEVNQRRIAILEEMARRLFEEWFVRFRYPGHEAVPLVDTELGLAPEGWVVAKLYECAEINPEFIKPKKAPSSINYIDISSVSIGRVEAVSAMAFADAPGRARRIVRNGDVIWSTVRPNRRSHALLLDLAPDTIASTGLAVLRARIRDWAWIYEASRTEAFTAFLTGRARGSAYPAVVGDDFEDLPLLLPAAPVRLAYQEKIGPMFMAAAKMSAQNARLRAARDLLLPKLISGEIDVSQAERRFAEAAE